MMAWPLVRSLLRLRDFFKSLILLSLARARVVVSYKVGPKTSYKSSYI